MTEQTDPLIKANYSGIFLTCFSEHNTESVHSIPVHSLNYVCSGEQVVKDGRREITVGSGEAVFVKRNHRTRIFKNGKDGQPYKGISLIFEKDVLRDFYNRIDKGQLPKKIDMPEANVFKIGQQPEIKSIFESLIPYLDGSAKPTEAVAHLKLLEGIHALLNTSDFFYKILFDFTDPWKIDILDFLNENYMDDLSIEQIATYTGRSLASFKRDFKKISSLSPQRWLIKTRLEAAYTLLKEDGKKIQDVYIEVGFKNPSHFSTAFKRQYGIAPTELM